MISNLLKKHFSSIRDILFIILVCIGINFFMIYFLKSPEVSISEIKKNITQNEKVIALGKLVPKGEIIRLSVANAESSRVNEILVQEGDWVKANQVIAILQGVQKRTQDLEESQKFVDFYKAKLEQILSGDAKKAEIAAQKANIARLEAQLFNEAEEKKAMIKIVEIQLKQAQSNYERNEFLHKEGAISQKDLDLSLEQLEITKTTLTQRKAQLNNIIQALQQQIIQEKENFAKLLEIRPVDIKVAQAELARALVVVKQRQADLDDTKVRVPISGQILRINTRVGEQVNIKQGIVEIGQTDQMYAVAEVYETDVAKVAIGQTVKIKSEYGGFEGEIRGFVEYIGLQVGNQQILDSSSDPTQDENSRVVQVKIRIHSLDSPKVASLTNMQVRIEIKTK
jgi:HlyD family secretion protein